MTQIALLFPGQGSQSVGMGADLYQAFAEAKDVFDRADEVLGFSLARLCFEGPEGELNDTANTQPAIYTATYALWQALAPRFAAVMPRVAFVAGHSLGEFSALAVGGAFAFEDGLRLVRCRGQAMRDAGLAAPGGMAAIIGLSDEAVAEAVAEANNGQAGVWIANLNSPGQVVIAGEPKALERAMVLATSKGAKRALPLAVSVACHTPLMGAAAERLCAALEATTLQKPWAPVVSNSVAEPVSDPAEIKAALMKQLTSPVRWVESVQAMAGREVKTMIEVGPKAVLAALVKRIDKAIAVTELTSAAGVQSFDAGAWA